MVNISLEMLSLDCRSLGDPTVLKVFFELIEVTSIGYSSRLGAFLAFEIGEKFVERSVEADRVW